MNDDFSHRTAVAGRAASVGRAAATIADIFARSAGRPCRARALIERGRVLSCKKNEVALA